MLVLVLVALACACKVGSGLSEYGTSTRERTAGTGAAALLPAEEPVPQPAPTTTEPSIPPGAIVDPTAPGVAPQPPAQAPAQSTVAPLVAVTLAWDANTEPILAGYRLYYGTAPRLYTVSIDVGTVTEYRVEGLLAGILYFFAVTAYGANGAESAFSDEVSYRG